MPALRWRVVKDKRRYITLADTMPENPKVEHLTDGAFRLLITCWCWCSRNGTDGHIVNASWQKRGTSKQRRELVDAGLADVTLTGVYMHDYLAHQWSSSEIDGMREKRAAAGSKGGRAKASNRVASASDLPEQVSSKRVAPNLTLPNTETTNVVSGAQGIVADWLSHCDQRPPTRVVGQASKEIARLLDEGFTAQQVTRAVATWHGKGLHPSTLASVLNETLNSKQKRSTTDDRVSAGLLLAEKYAALEQPAIGAS